MKNYNGVYINKITIIKNVLMKHTTDKKRGSFNKEIFEIEFDNGDKVYLVMKPKEMQVCFNGIDFELEDTIFTKRKVIFRDVSELEEEE